MMKKALLTLVFIMAALSSLSCYAGEWTRVSPNTISFVGELDTDDFSKFEKVYKSTDTTLIVNSTGGRMDSGLAIGKVLINNPNLTVVVHGVCASSCANYLFLAGRTKIIDHGVVGFHGNWKAMVQSEKFKKEVSEADPAARSKLLAYHQQKVLEETDFMARTGADQKLFDKTQRENDDGIYDIYLPGPYVFAKYGIKNVSGNQDLDFVRSNPDIKIFYDDSTSGSIAPTDPTISR